MKPYRRNKKDKESPYYVQFFINGRRVQYCTGKTDYYEALNEGQRQACALREGKVVAAANRDEVLTIQMICDRYLASAVHVKRETRVRNIACLRRVLAVQGIKIGDSAMRITRSLFVAFQVEYLKQGKSPVGINSVTRQAKSIFSDDCMPLYEGMHLPDIKEALSSKYLPEGSRQYTPPPADFISSIQSRAAELKQLDAPSYAGFLLAMLCGLRSKEVIHAEWSWVKETPKGSALEVPAAMAKSGNSRMIRISEDALTELKALSGGGQFLVPAKSPTDRAKAIKYRLSAWLRDNGVKRGGKTVHELRKYFGSLMATKHGIFAAQRVLGHSDPSITSRTYAGLLELPEPVALPSPVPASGG